MKIFIVIVILLVGSAVGLGYYRQRSATAIEAKPPATAGAEELGRTRAPVPQSAEGAAKPAPAPRSALQRILDNDLPAPKSIAGPIARSEPLSPNLKRILESKASIP